MWTLRTDKKGKWAIFKPYEYKLLQILHRQKGSAMTTGEAHEMLETEKITISRASVIQKLQEWAEDGLIETANETAKGGVRAKYTMNKTQREIQQHIASRFVDKLNEALPNVLVTVLK